MGYPVDSHIKWSSFMKSSGNLYVTIRLLRVLVSLSITMPNYATNGSDFNHRTFKLENMANAICNSAKPGRCPFLFKREKAPR